MKRVYSSFDRIAVHHAKNVLMAAGIECVVRNELLSSAMGELPPAECQAELWVRDAFDAARAEALLREDRPADARGAWSCPRCGEHAEGQFSQCWRCGAYRRV